MKELVINKTVSCLAEGNLEAKAIYNFVSTLGVKSSFSDSIVSKTENGISRLNILLDKNAKMVTTVTQTRKTAEIYQQIAQSIFERTFPIKKVNKLYVLS